MIKLIDEYLSKSCEYSMMRFVFEMYLISLIMKILIIVVSMILITIYEPFERYLFGETHELGAGNSHFTGLTWLQALLVLCIVTPLIESVIFQGIPIWIISKFSNNKLLHIISSSLVFVYFHSSINGSFAYLLTIFSAGLILAWSFFVFSKRSFKTGVFVATAIHFLYNFTVFITVYLF